MWLFDAEAKVLSEDKTATHLYLKFSHVMQLIAMIKHVLHWRYVLFLGSLWFFLGFFGKSWLQSLFDLHLQCTVKSNYGKNVVQQKASHVYMTTLRGSALRKHVKATSCKMNGPAVCLLNHVGWSFVHLLLFADIKSMFKLDVTLHLVSCCLRLLSNDRISF